MTNPPALRGLCVVLFGMPAAGKSSLLGALFQAANNQPGLLGGELKDLSGGLHELQDRVYQEKVQETLDEVVPYSVTFQPQDQRRPVAATLIDCDGRVAYTYLMGQRELGATQGQVDLAAAIEEADTLLLVVDASAAPDQLKRDFLQFSEFLKLLEKHRSKNAEVAGLPVYLVLTKCDLLAQEKDTTSLWLQRIEEAKRRISQRFKEYLAQEAEREKMAFGQVDLHVWATAVKRPALADKPARPTEPYGVAELFRQCFESGLSFDLVQKKAERRLQAVLIGIVGLLGLLLITAGVFFFSQPSTELTALENQARNVLPAESSTAKERLRGPLEEKTKQLDKVLKHPDFKRLPEILQDRVHTAHHELKTYEDLSQRFKEADRPLSGINDEDALLALDKAIKSIQIPEIYVEQWKGLDLTRELDDRRDKISTFRLRMAETEGMLRKRIQEGEALLEDRPKGLLDPKLGKWLAQVNVYFNSKIPDPAVSLPGLPEVTYRRLYEFRSMESLLGSLQIVEKQLMAAKQKVVS